MTVYMWVIPIACESRRTFEMPIKSLVIPGLRGPSSNDVMSLML